MTWLRLLGLFLLLQGTSLAQTKLAGTVEDGEGRPVQGAVVLAAARDAAFDESPATATTDGRGAFEIELASGGRYVVEVVAPGYVPWSSRSIEPGEPLRIVLARGGEILEGVVAGREHSRARRFGEGRDAHRTPGTALRHGSLLGRVETVTNDATPAGNVLVKAAKIGEAEGVASLSVPDGGRGTVEIVLVPVAPGR